MWLHNLTDQKIKLTGLTLQFFQALGAVSVGGLAIYAYFFTNLPTELARQYQSEIADSKEQLTDLRRQRHVLEEQAAAFRRENSELDSTRTALETELVSQRKEFNMAQQALREAQEGRDIAVARLNEAVQLEAKINETVARLRQQTSNLQTQIVSLSTQRLKYLESAIGMNLIVLHARVRSELTELRQELEKAKDLVEIPRWIQAKNQFNASIANLPTQRQVEAIQNHRYENERFINYELTRELSRETSRRQVLEELRAHLIARSGWNVTGYDLVVKYATREAFGLVHDDDWSEVSRRLQENYRTNANILNRPLRVRIQTDSPDQDIAMSIKVTEENLGSFERYLRDLMGLVK